MKLVLFGATGHIGQRILREALARGHEVTAVVRNPAAIEITDDRLRVVQGDATDAASVAAAARGADAILSAVGNTKTVPGPEPMPLFGRVAHALISGARAACVTRVMVLGGAGSLEAAPGVHVVDTPGFPDEYKGDALGQRAALAIWRSPEAEGIDWTYVSPAGMIGPGPKSGKYRVGGDQLLVDSAGESRISYDDYALGFLDVLESGRHLRDRITIAY